VQESSGGRGDHYGPCASEQPPEPRHWRTRRLGDLRETIPEAVLALVAIPALTRERTRVLEKTWITEEQASIEDQTREVLRRES